jgi:CheY-like chemotaxis protein
MVAPNGGSATGPASGRDQPVVDAGAGESGVRRAIARPRRALLVEDEDMVRKVVGRMLAARGFEVQAVGSGSEALALLDAPEPPDLDLLVTDLMMPDGGGLPVARSFKARFPKIEVLLVSGYSPTNAEGWGDHFPFLTKPFGSADLAKALDQLFASR